MTTVTAAMMTKTKAPVKFRHELKYNINQLDDTVLSHRLGKLFQYDKNAGSHGTYRVSSLYFDTPYDKALRQKIDGVHQREKFRLRYYNNDTSFIRLEKKIKTNGLCGKYSEQITATQVQQLLDGNIDFLLDHEKPLFLEFYSKLKGQLLSPKTIVAYDREAFLYTPGNVRITIDRHLHTGLNSIDFLNPNLYHMDISENLCILEVKYDAFLPEIVRLAVQMPSRRITAFSKYATCRRYD